MGSGKGPLGRREGIQTDCEELVPSLMTTVGCMPPWVSSEWRGRWENASKDEMGFKKKQTLNPVNKGSSGKQMKRSWGLF